MRSLRELAEERRAQAWRDRMALMRLIKAHLRAVRNATSGRRLQGQRHGGSKVTTQPLLVEQQVPVRALFVSPVSSCKEQTLIGATPPVLLFRGVGQEGGRGYRMAPQPCLGTCGSMSGSRLRWLCIFPRICPKSTTSKHLPALAGPVLRLALRTAQARQASFTVLR